MADKHKIGLDFFYFPVDFFSEEAIEFAAARFGVKGEVIAIRLLCKIHRKGYYTEWTEDDAIMFAKRVGENVTAALVNDVVEELARRGFFDKDILSSFKVLTSPEIQKRYLNAAERRLNVDILNHLLLIDTDKYKNVNIVKQNVHIEPTKERKGNKGKKDSSGETPPGPDFKKIYKELVKDKTSVHHFLKTNSPDFIEPYVDYWNFFAESKKLPTVKITTDKRRKHFKARRDEPDFDFLEIIKKASLSTFLTTGTFFSFDWIVESQANYVKILEGNYDNKTESNGQSKAETNQSAYKPLEPQRNSAPLKVKVYAPGN